MKIIGHRGAMGLAPENTQLSLEKALEFKVDMIEIDVRVTKDNLPILQHGEGLISNLHGKMSVCNYTFAELKANQSDLIKLEDAIKIVAGKVPLVVEVKRIADILPVVKTINKLMKSGLRIEHVLLGSKYKRVLYGLHKELPDIEKVVIEPWSGVRANLRARRVNAKKIFMNQRWLWSGFIKSVSRKYELYPYVINSPSKTKRWAKYGIAGVITDHPERF